jgi:hypothetical protein
MCHPVYSPPQAAPEPLGCSVAYTFWSPTISRTLNLDSGEHGRCKEGELTGERMLLWAGTLEMKRRRLCRHR